MQNQNILKKVKSYLINNKFDDARFKFEQDIVFNPKSEIHIYTLSKILTNKIKKFRRAKFKYSYVINPKNEEAIYYLAKVET